MYDPHLATVRLRSGEYTASDKKCADVINVF